jgi:hypothetical protein
MLLYKGQNALRHLSYIYISCLSSSSRLLHALESNGISFIPSTFHARGSMEDDANDTHELMN